MASVIAEYRWTEAIGDDELEQTARALDRALERRGARWQRSYLSADRRRMVCEFEAADAERVRLAHRDAGVTVGDVWGAERSASGEAAGPERDRAAEPVAREPEPIAPT